MPPVISLTFEIGVTVAIISFLHHHFILGLGGGRWKGKRHNLSSSQVLRLRGVIPGELDWNLICMHISEFRTNTTMRLILSS